MKKIVMLLILALVSALQLLPETLADAYRRGRLTLRPDGEFARNQEWKKLFGGFATPDDEGYDAATRHDLAVAPDGSVFVSNYYQFSFYKFDASGNFLFKFGEEGRRTPESSPINRRPALGAVQDGASLLTHEHQGRLVIYDLEGKEIRRLNCDYEIETVEALSGETFAVNGWVLWHPQGLKFRIALKDLRDGRERPLREHVDRDHFANMAFVKTDQGGMVGVGGRPVPVYAFARATPGGELVTAISSSPEIEVFGRDGRRVRRFRLQGTAPSVAEAEKRDYYVSIDRRLDALAQKHPELARQAEKAKSSVRQAPYPASKGHFRCLLVDSEGNILVFPQAAAAEKGILFQAYSPAGEFIASCRLQEAGWKVHFDGRQRRALFHKGFLYALAEDTKNGHLRLARFKLE